MNLVMFDIDGTLTQTNAVDTQCFITALNLSLGISGIETDWSKYAHVTDQGCLQEIIAIHYGRPGTIMEFDAARGQYLSLLRMNGERDRTQFQAVPGAKNILSALTAYPETAVAVATGAWRESAELKLRLAGIPMEGIPFACNDDAESREEIMRIAEERAGNSVPCIFHSRTYVGDGVWDLEAASALGYHFIGVATGGEADRLRAAGARWVVEDLREGNGFLKILRGIWDGESTN